MRITVKAFQHFLGVPQDGNFGPASKAAMFKRFSNRNAPAITDQDINDVAMRLGVKPAVIRAVRRVEAPRGAFDDQGRPTILFEKHYLSELTNHKYDASHPDISAKSWQPGTYGPSSSQWDRLARAVALDPEAAFKSCSWGAFQVMGKHSEAMGYDNVFQMALELTKSEGNHLVTFERFVKMNKLEDELRQCKANDPRSCIPFVSRYNGKGYARNNYHVNFAREIARAGG